MDERTRRHERTARTGDRAAAERFLHDLRRRGVEPALTVEERIALGLFDTFETRLRDDIVNEAERVAEEGTFAEDVCLDPARWPVDLFVNGMRLVDVVGGGYTPQLAARWVYLPSRYLLGEPDPALEQYEGDEGRTLLLYCSCGDDLCGRLLARITTTPDAVVWSELMHRPSAPAEATPLDGVAFVFSRAAYERALEDPKP